MAIPNSFMTLRAAPDRYGVDVQTLPNKPQIYKRCECGAMIYVGDKYWNYDGNIACKECIDDVLRDYERMAE